jgi:hypothetical protein
MSNESLDESDEEVAVLLPVVSKELDVDPLLLALLSCAAFLDLSTEEAVDPEDAVDVLELVGTYVQRLPEERIEELKEQLADLHEWAKQQGWSHDKVEFVRDFLFNCGVGAEDDDEDEDDEDDDDEDEKE